MKLRFTHGSPSLIDKFRLFNYEIDRSDNKRKVFGEDVNFTGNGNDAFGVGIYAFNGMQVDEAAGYAAVDGEPGHGYAYVLEVDANGYINDLEPDYLSGQDWADIYESMIEGIREIHDYSEETMYSKLSEVTELYEEHGDDWAELDSAEDLISEIETMSLGNFSATDEAISDYGDPSEWIDNLMELYRELCDPTDLIEMSRSHGDDMAESIENELYQFSDFWQVLTHMNLTIATRASGCVVSSYNDLFVTEVLKRARDEDDLSVARAGDGIDFSVIFNPDAINITHTLDLERKYGKKAVEADSALAM